jgi:hypothetical protein
MTPDVDEVVAQLREHAQAMRNGFAEYGDAHNATALLGTAGMCDAAADLITQLKLELSIIRKNGVG